MNKGITCQYRTDTCDQYCSTSNIDTVEKIVRKGFDLIENIPVVTEIEAPRPQISPHRVGK